MTSSYSLLRDSKVVIFYDGVWYVYDAISSLSFSQTYNRRTNFRKTLHKKVSTPIGLIGSKNTANLSMDIVCTTSGIESVFLELLGMEPGYNEQGDTVYGYPESLGVAPKTCDIFVTNKGASVYFNTCAIEGLDVRFDKTTPLTFSVTFTAANMQDSVALPTLGDYEEQGTVLAPTPLDFAINGSKLNSIISAGLTFQQTIGWRNDRGLHDVGQFYYHTLPILEEFSMGVTTSTYHRHSGLVPQTESEPSYADVFLGKSGFSVDLRNVMLSKRFTASDVYTDNHDITITELTNYAAVGYQGITTINSES